MKDNLVKGNSSEEVILVLSLEEIQHILSKSTDREKLIVRILYETGCTVKELTEIQTNDAQNNSLRINSRLCMISPDTQKILNNWPRDQKYLLSTRQSEKMTPRRIRQLLEDLSQRAIAKKITPHDLRYSHFAHALDRGISLRSIQERLGLKTQRTAQIYRIIVGMNKNEYASMLENV